MKRFIFIFTHDQCHIYNRKTWDVSTAMFACWLNRTRSRQVRTVHVPNPPTCRMSGADASCKILMLVCKRAVLLKGRWKNKNYHSKSVYQTSKLLTKRLQVNVNKTQPSKIKTWLPKAKQQHVFSSYVLRTFRFQKIAFITKT